MVKWYMSLMEPDYEGVAPFYYIGTNSKSLFIKYSISLSDLLTGP